MTDPNEPTPDHPTSVDIGGWLTRARHIFYGTATSVIEALQDPDKRDENLAKLGMDLGDLADELAGKGALTEAEALEYVQQMQRIQQEQTPSAAPVTIDIEDPDADSQGSKNTDLRVETFELPIEPEVKIGDPSEAVEVVVETPDNRVSQQDIQALMDLTRQVESLRMDLERQRADRGGDAS